ncbi:MAG: His-Xaa-Ser repeat protein HxsA3 [Eubacterium sp.]
MEIKKNIENLIEDEEGDIPGKKLLMLGTMMVILGNLLSIDAFAAHRSHKYMYLIAHIVLVRMDIVIVIMEVMRAQEPLKSYVTFKYIITFKFKI